VTTHPDLEGLYDDLSDVEEAAKDLKWADARPWRRTTHLWIEKGVPVIDLHDLNVRLGKAVVAQADFDAVAAGAVILVTGVGRHSMGSGSALRKAVSGKLGHRAAASGWELRPLGSGRLLLVTDAARAPGWASGGLGWPLKLGIAAFVAAAVWVCMGTPGMS